MNTKATFYAVACASLVINYFTAPIAAPVIWDSVKSHTAEHLMALASDLHPTRPTYIPPVQKSALDRAEGKQAAMPPKLDITEAQKPDPQDRPTVYLDDDVPFVWVAALISIGMYLI